MHETLFGLGRLLASSDDKSRLYKDWLHICETTHQNCNAFAQPIPISKRPIRLVDVRSGRVIESSMETRYIALSYVWGQQNHLRLFEHNYETFKQNGIDGVIPQTIRDAIDIVKRLGEAYLWVDALCIIQDSEVDKRSQLSQMASIFAKAVLVIVAAAGEDAHVGLFPERDKSIHKQKPLRIGDMTLLTILDPRVSKKSKGLPWKATTTECKASKHDWTRRAWTFQEILFARRALICKTDQTYWYCKCSIWYEESAFEPVHRAQDISAFSESGPQAAFAHEAQGIELAVPGLSHLRHENFEIHASGAVGYVPLQTYKAFVSEYSSRFMSDTRDLTVAFEGVLQALQHQHPWHAPGWPGLDLIWGISRHEFGWALAWSASDLVDCHRQERLRRSRGSDWRAIPPSWSWTAWYSDNLSKDCISIGDSSSLFSIIACPAEVIFYRLAADNALYRIDEEYRLRLPSTTPGYGPNPADIYEDKSQREPQFSCMDWKEEPTEIAIAANDGIPVDFRDTSMLKFYTSTATLVMLRWKDGEAHDYWLLSTGHVQYFCKSPHEPGLPCYSCSQGREGSLVMGQVYMGSTDHIPAHEHEHKDWISEEYRRKVHELSSFHHDRINNGDFLVFDFCVISRSSTDHSNLNALIVEWIDGVAYRVGIAIISEAIWVHVLNRRWRLVTLG